MPKTPTDRPSGEKVTASHSNHGTRHIRTRESDAPDLELAARIKELIGDDTQVGFAKACGFSEGMLRKYLKGARPGKDNLVAMAKYRNVSLQWLATGMLPRSGGERALVTHSAGSGKTGTSLRAMQYLQHSAAEHQDGMINCGLLRMCLIACSTVHGEDFGKALLVVQVEYACDFYNQLVGMAASKGPRVNLDDFCRLEPNALADQLRFFLQMGWARRFPFELPDAGTW